MAEKPEKKKADKDKIIAKWFVLIILGFILALIYYFDLGTVDDDYLTCYRSSPETAFSLNLPSKWFQNGNLHKATIAEWKNASYQNKLATAADWLAATKWKGHLASPDDFDRLKSKAQMLVNAVDKVTTAITVDHDHEQVTHIAAALITLSNDIGP